MYLKFCIILVVLPLLNKCQTCTLQDQINNFSEKILQNDIPRFQTDPYKNQSPEYIANVQNALFDKQTVCAIQYLDITNKKYQQIKVNLNMKKRYILQTFQSAEEAVNNQFIVTHQGKCGACSTLQDLVVYLTKDLTRPVRKCGIFNPTQKQLFQCIKNLGFTDACTDIWVFNTKYSKSKCFGVCMKSFLMNEPFVKPNGELNNCLQCDEDISGPIFKYESGRTRRNSGIHSEIDRPNDQIYDITHCYF